MRLLVDGKEIPVQDSVKIVYELNGEVRAVEHKTELHLNFQQEGLVAEVFQGGSAKPVGTSFADPPDLAYDLGLR